MKYFTLKLYGHERAPSHVLEEYSSKFHARNFQGRAVMDKSR
jgi:hypothetical protein